MSAQEKIARPKGARKNNHHSTAPHVRHGFFKSFDGTKLFYSIEGQGQPLVFCYGLICSSLHWTYQIEHFRNSYQTIWFDYRGHQNSESPANMESLTIENIAKDLNILLDELEIKKPVLLGHSMGVNVVLEYYRQYPERVSGLVLANGVSRQPLDNLFHTNAVATAFQGLNKLHSLAPNLVRYAWGHLGDNPITKTIVAMGGFNPYLTPKEDVDLYIKQVANMDPAILLQLSKNFQEYNASSWLHEIKVPTLVLAGEYDMITPIREQELMHQLIPGSLFEIIRHGSHCPQMDLPEFVNQKIENFLNTFKY